MRYRTSWQSPAVSLCCCYYYPSVAQIGKRWQQGHIRSCGGMPSWSFTWRQFARRSRLGTRYGVLETDKPRSKSRLESTFPWLDHIRDAVRGHLWVTRTVEDWRRRRLLCVALVGLEELAMRKCARCQEGVHHLSIAMVWEGLAPS